MFFDVSLLLFAVISHKTLGQIQIKEKRTHFKNSSVLKAAILVTVYLNLLNIDANCLTVCSVRLCYINLSTLILCGLLEAQFRAVYHGE